MKKERLEAEEDRKTPMNVCKVISKCIILVLYRPKTRGFKPKERNQRKGRG